MELKIKIGYKEILELVKQLPNNQLTKLRAELDNVLVEEKSNKDISELQELLLSGPVMSDEQYDNFKKNRQHFGSWRK